MGLRDLSAETSFVPGIPVNMWHAAVAGLTETDEGVEGSWAYPSQREEWWHGTAVFFFF